MRFRKLGSSDLEVSEISLGSWLTYSGGVEAEQTRACTEAAFDAGINFFDTANVYGQGAAEAAWGEILSRRPRDSYILTTKVFFPMSDDPADQGLSGAQVHKQTTPRSSACAPNTTTSTRRTASTPTSR